MGMHLIGMYLMGVYLKNDLENALISLLQKRPDLRQPLRQKIKCTAVFGNW